MTEEKPVDPTFLDDYVLYRMALASHHMSAEFHAIVREQGLRVPEWRILATLASYEPQNVTQLREKVLYDQPRLTKTIAKMVEAGLLDRRQDGGDRRVVNVTLTANGRAIAIDLIEKARDHERRALEGLTPTERKQLKNVLRKLM